MTTTLPVLIHDYYFVPVTEALESRPDLRTLRSESVMAVHELFEEKNAGFGVQTIVAGKVLY